MATPKQGVAGWLPWAVMLCCLLSLCACKVELFASLPEGEANEVVALLMQAGLSASKSAMKEGASSVTVEQADFSRAVTLLSQHGHPRKQFQTIGDVFQQSGLVTSPVQERARFLWALGQELSSTISQIDGVLTARVQVVLPDNDLMRREPSPSSASVFIRYDAQSQASKLVPQIKTLVATSVEGLSYDKVSVVLVPVEAQELARVVPVEDAAAQLGPLLGMGTVAGLGLAAYLGRRRLAALLRRTTIRAAE